MSVKFLQKFLIFLGLVIFLQPQEAYSRAYISAGYNYGQFIYKPMKDLNVGPKGGGPGFIYGVNFGVINTEVIYNKLSLEAPFIHDNVNNTFKQDSSSLAFALSIYLNKFLYLRFGYQLSNIDQSFTSQSASADQTVKTRYGVLEDYSGKGFLYGVGVNLFGGKDWNIFTQVTNSEVHEEGKELLIQGGFRIYFSTKSLFSK